MTNLINSDSFLERALPLIPALTQTFSKGPYSYVEGVYPTFLSRGKGSYVFDVDDNRYLDYVLGLGPITLGYGYKSVNDAIKSQLKNGISFSIPHYLEVELSEKICSMIPSADMVKFSKTGSDAGTAAVRAARAFTEKNNIAYCGTGGVWHDWFTVITSRNKGIPKNLKKMIKKFEYNNIESLKEILEDWKNNIAAVYIEPVLTELPKNNFLKNVKKLAHKHDALLIFDEVVTGFRLANGGAQEFLNIDADIAVFGKGIANGMPLGAITGKKKFMEQFENIFYSTTYGGETLSLAAANAVLTELETKPVIKYCWNIGEKLQNGFNKICADLNINVKMEGLPVRSTIVCRDKNNIPSQLLKSILLQETIKRGILFGPGYVFISYSHSKTDICKTLKKCESSLKILKKAIDSEKPKDYLQGNIMKRVMTF